MGFKVGSLILFLVSSCQTANRGASGSQLREQDAPHLLTCRSVDEVGDGYRFTIDRLGFDELPGVPIVVEMIVNNTAKESLNGRAEISEIAVKGTFGPWEIDVKSPDEVNYSGTLKSKSVERQLACSNATTTGNAASARRPAPVAQHMLTCRSVDEVGDRYVFTMDRRGFDEQPGIPIAVVISVNSARKRTFPGRASVSEDAITATFAPWNLKLASSDGIQYIGSLEGGAVSRQVSCETQTGR